MREYYECQNPECENVTEVQTWAPTRYEPGDSTHGDGCSECGEELCSEPTEGPEPDYEAMEEARLLARGEEW